MLPNMTNFDLIWSVTPNWAGGQILKLAFWAKLGINQFVSTRETWWCQICCCRTNCLEVIVEKWKVWKNSAWPHYILTPGAKTVWLEVKSKNILQIAHFIVLPLLFADWSYLLLGQLKRCTACLTKNGKHFALMTSFDIKNVDPRSQNLHQEEFLCGLPPPPPGWVFLGLLGAEIGSVILRPSPSSLQTLQTLPLAF